MTIPHPKPPAPLSPNGAGQPGPPPSSPVPDGGPGTFDPGSGQVCARLAGPVPLPAGHGREEQCPAGITSHSQYRLELPAGLKLLSQNQRLHYMERYRRAKEIKKAAWAKALHAKVPSFERAAIVVEYQPPANRDTDADNVPPASGKPAIDGLVAAGRLPDDSKRYVVSVKGVVGPVYPRGRIVLHVTEVPG